VLEHLMKTRSTEVLRHLLSISQPWGRRVQSTNPIRGYDLRIRLASCWTRRYPYPASSGIPPQEILEECRAKRIVTIGTATTPEEGAAHQEAGVDAIVASGLEAGGHRGSFLRAAEDSPTGTFSLVPQIADMVNVPVIAAGGIADARGVIAALALGAEAVQMGTVFLACEESGASLLHRQSG
jgi:NAD(P)H-dependent flavin oxidoreductase YrpB (nitropropane dioxygenase family)